MKLVILVLAVLLALLLAAAVYLNLRYAAWKQDQLDTISGGSKKMAVAGGQIEYQHLQHPSETVILYLHGSPGGHDQAIHNEHFQVITPSRPGYLNTPLEMGATPREQARAYSQLLDELGVLKVVVIGASGGGPSALAFAERYSERTSALILIEAVTAPLDIPAIPSFMTSDFTFWLVMGSMQNVLGLDGIASRLIPDPANHQRLLNDPAALERFGKTIWSIWPYSERQIGWENDKRQFKDFAVNAEAIELPTLVIHGTADTSVPFTQSEAMAKRLPNATLVPIEGADHMMPLTHQQELADLVNEFILSYQTQSERG